MKKWLHHQCFTNCFQILSNSISAVITYHNPENRPQNSGICVANHTSPIDVLILACDNSYALVSSQIGSVLNWNTSIFARPPRSDSPTAA